MAVSFGKNGTGRTCDAVPNAIPLAIWPGDNDHRQLFNGDHDIPFSPVIASGLKRGATWPLVCRHCDPLSAVPRAVCSDRKLDGVAFTMCGSCSPLRSQFAPIVTRARVIPTCTREPASTRSALYGPCIALAASPRATIG